MKTWKSMLPQHFANKFWSICVLKYIHIYSINSHLNILHAPCNRDFDLEKLLTDLKITFSIHDE